MPTFALSKLCRNQPRAGTPRQPAKHPDDNYNLPMKRVFHIISHFDMGGAERVAASIAKSASPDMEYHVLEVVRGRSAYTRVFLGELRACGVRCHRSLMPDIRFHFVFERIAALLFPLRFICVWLRWRPDVVHTHTEVPDMSTLAFFTLFPSLLRKCRLVRTIHNTRLWTGQRRLGAACERVFRRVGANVAISPSVRDAYANTYGEQAPIIPNGVELPEAKPYPSIAKGKVNILFAGRLEPQKGVARLLDIIEAMADDGRYFFHVMGDGQLLGEAQRRLAGLPNARLTPPLYGLSAFMPSFDYMIMPSEFEGLSIVSIEASMAGLPNIINNCPGLKDTMPPDWPLKVEGNSLEQYLYLLRRVLPGADREALANRARAYATEHFGIDAMRRQYEEIYRKER